MITMNESNSPALNGHEGALEGDRPSKKSKLVNKAIVAALVVSMLALFVILRWAVADETPLEIKNSPFPTRTIREHPTAGGVIIMTADYCKHTNATGRLRVSFVSSSREIFQPVVDERGPKGCNKTEFPVLIPKDIPPDTYKVKFRATYDLNPLKRNITQEFESQPVVVNPTTATSER